MKEKEKRQLLPYIKMVFKLIPSLKLVLLWQTLLSVIWSLVPVGFVKILLDTYEAGKGFKSILITCSIVAIIYICNGMMNRFLDIFRDRLFRKLSFKMKNKIYEKIDEVDYATYQSSDFLNKYQKLLNEGIWNAWNTVWYMIMIIEGIVIVLAMSSIIALVNIVALAYTLVMSIVYFFTRRIAARLFRLADESNKQNFRERYYIRRMYYLKDAAADLRTTPVSNLFLGMNDKVGSNIVHNIDKYKGKEFIFVAIGEIFMRSVYAFVVAIIAYETLRDLSFASFAALIAAAESLFYCIWNFSYSIGNFQQVAINSIDYFRVMDIKPVIENSGSIVADEFSIINIIDVSFKYNENDKFALENINLKLKKGERIAIVGENGSGKTTLVKLLLRLYDPIKGSILFNDTNYKDIFPKSIRSRCGAVFQDYQVYALSVAENVLMREIINDDDRKLVIEALVFSGLYDKIKDLPLNIDTQITKEFEEDGLELSGGEKQKLALARIYASEYELIILDEPSSSLDPIAEADIYEKMMKLNKFKSLIFISHRLSTTKLADFIYLFDQGKIIEKGTHEELMNIDNGIYKNMFNVQAKEYVERSAGYENDKK